MTRHVTRALRAGLTLTADLHGIAGDGPYERRGTIAGRPVCIGNRGPSAHTGRFGGGWERELGVQLGRRGVRGTIIVNLWRGSIRIDPRPAS